MTQSIDRAKLKSLVDAHALGGVLGPPAKLEFTVGRLNDFFARYVSHRHRHGNRTSLPPQQGWADLVHQSDTNPHRISVLLQAIAFLCSSEMLAMLWMVQLGASVKELHIDHERESLTKLKVLLDLPGDEEVTEEFVSDEHWDLALLQFASISKVDELPVIGGLVALRLPGMADGT